MTEYTKHANYQYERSNDLWAPDWTLEQYQHHVEQVCQDIRVAFQNVPYPGDDHLTVGQTYHPEDREIAEFLQGKTWEELPKAYVCNYGGGLWLFTPGAYQYYLPAYLLAHCEPDLQLGAEIHNMLLIAVSVDPMYAPPEVQIAELEARFAPFTLEQKRALKHFMALRCYLREPDAQWVYELFWKQF